jgi:hypothetical protein
MVLFSIIFDVIPQIQIGAEMVTEVTSWLLHFLVSTALLTTAATTVYNTLASMTCIAPTLLITFASLIGVMLVSIMPSSLISGTVRLIVHVVALVKIRTSLLPGASLAMASGGRRQWSRCTPLVDLDCGCFQISLDSVKCRGFWEFVEFVHGDGNVGARHLKNLLVVAHVESVSPITTDIVLATRGCISCIDISLFSSSPL